MWPLFPSAVNAGEKSAPDIPFTACHTPGMEKWKLYAYASAVFAGFTAIVARAGLKTMSADLGLAVRSVFVSVFVLLNLLFWGNIHTVWGELKSSSIRTHALLALSALTTALSWICYYRAIKDGQVSYVALVDKGSIIITVVCSVLLLGDPFSWRLAGGTVLVLAGLFVLAGGK